MAFPPKGFPPAQAQAQPPAQPAQAPGGPALKQAMASRFTRGKMSAAKDERSESPAERAREKRLGIP